MAKKVVYLTIDDAPTQDLPGKLDFLKANNIPAVLFCIGNNLDERPQVAIDAIREGFVLGNHSYDHPHFSDISVEEACDQISRTDSILDRLYAEAATPRPSKVFRFPYGDKGDLNYGDETKPLTQEGKARKLAIQTHLRRLGYTQPRFEGVTYPYYREGGFLDDVDWLWTYDVMEWSVFSDQHVHGIDSFEKVLDRMEEDVPDGWRGLNDLASEEIILTHDHVASTEIFYPIIKRLQEKELIFRLPSFQGANT